MPELVKIATTPEKIAMLEPLTSNITLLRENIIKELDFETVCENPAFINLIKVIAKKTIIPCVDGTFNIAIKSLKSIWKTLRFITKNSDNNV